MMKSRMAWFRYFIPLFIFCLWGSNVFAYELAYTSGGHVLKWNTNSVTYYINTSGGPSDSLSAIYYAMSTWTSVSSSNFTFVYGGTTTSTAHGSNDGYNITDFGGGLESGTIAENAVWYNSSTGSILDSDIRFNTSYAWNTTGSAGAMDVQNIATHEFGHSLLLDDLYGAADSDKTMYGYSSYGETKKRMLDTDDINGVAYLYPASPSCPDLYSWDGGEYLNNGYIYGGSHCIERESYQERKVTQPVTAVNDVLLRFKVKEVEDEESHINSIAMYYKNSGSDWKELELISAVHNKAGDVQEALRKKDNHRVDMVAGDEILLIYRAPSGDVEHAEFKSVSSGYYLFTAQTVCQVLDLGPALSLRPGDIVTLQARINNMSASALPSDARVYFDIHGNGYSNKGTLSMSVASLPPGSPKWYSLNWTIPDDVPAGGGYTYSAAVYIGTINVTFDDKKYDGSENKKEVAEAGSSCQ